MDYNYLGKTGLKVSNIGLGAMNLGNLEKTAAFAILDKAYDLGINLIDTASGYAHSESILGEWMAESDNREEMIINTKVGWPTGKGQNDRGLSRKYLTRSLHQTLHDLQTDYIDIYQPHYYDGHENLEMLVNLFHEFSQDHHITSIGAPLFMRAYNMVTWHYLAKQHGLNSIGSKLLTTSLLSRGMYDGDTRHIAKDLDIGLITFGALGGGLLTGKYHSNEEYKGKEMFRKIVESGKIDGLVERLRQMATELDTTVVKVSFAWVLSHDFMDSVIIGASSPDQLEDIMTATELTLSSEMITELTELSNKYKLW